MSEPRQIRTILPKVMEDIEGRMARDKEKQEHEEKVIQAVKDYQKKKPKKKRSRSVYETRGVFVL